MINAWTLKRMADNEIIYINHGNITNHSDKYIVTSGVHDIANDPREGAMMIRCYKYNCIVQRKGNQFIINDITKLNTIEQVYEYHKNESYIMVY